MKKKWIIITAVILVLLVGGYFYFNGSTDIVYQTEAAAKKDLVKTVSATGSVKSSEEINLNFEAAGRITRMNVDVGSIIKVGQLLASIDARAVEADVSQSRASLSSAEADLDKVRSGASAEDLAVSKRQIEQMQTEVATAQSNILNLQNEQTDKVNAYRQTALNNLSSKNFYSRTALDAVKAILDTENAKNVLSTSYPSYYTMVSSSYPILNSQYNTVEAAIDNISNQSSNDNIINSLSILVDYQNDISQLLKNTFLMLENTFSSTYLSSTTIDSYKTSIKTQQGYIESSLSATQSSKSNLSSTIISYQNQITSAQNNLEAKQRSLSLAEAQYQLKSAKPRSFDIRSAESRVAQGRANLQSALANLAKYQITSPLEGTVVKVHKKRGEQANPNDQVLTVIGKSKLEIEVDIPEADISDIVVGDLAEITLDAYGQNKKFSGHVTFIEPAETQIQDVVYYRMKIQFDQNDTTIKSGMTANISIKVEEKKDVLAIPLRGISYRDNQYFIKTKVNEEISEKTVTVGLKGDSGYAEILSGLSEGEQVVVGQQNAK